MVREMVNEPEGRLPERRLAAKESFSPPGLERSRATRSVGMALPRSSSALSNISSPDPGKISILPISEMAWNTRGLSMISAGSG